MKRIAGAASAIPLQDRLGGKEAERVVLRRENSGRSLSRGVDLIGSRALLRRTMACRAPFAVLTFGECYAQPLLGKRATKKGALLGRSGSVEERWGRI